MECVKKVAEEIVKDGAITREFADQQIQELQLAMQKENLQSQKQGDASRIFLMNLYKLGKIPIAQVSHYAEKLQLMDNKPASAPAQPDVPSSPHQTPAVVSQVSTVSQAGSHTASQSNPIFKVFDLNKDDGQRKMLQFVFSTGVVQYIVRGKRPVEITFDEITHHDVSDGQIIISTPDQTYQLGLSDIQEQDKLRKCLDSIGHEDDLTLVEENVLMQGYLDKKGPSYAIASKKRFVRVTHGKLSYYKMDSSQSYEAPLNSIVLNSDLNEVKRFSNDGFSIVLKSKEKEFSFMVPKGKLKADDIYEKREEWINAIKQAYMSDEFPASIHPAIPRGGSSNKSSGTHLIQLAKQQLESMLVILKGYEAEDECAAQASKMHQLFNDIEQKLIQSTMTPQQVMTPVRQYPTPKKDLDSVSCPSAEDLKSIHSNSSSNEESTVPPFGPPQTQAPIPPSFTPPSLPAYEPGQSAVYDDIEIRPLPTQTPKTPSQKSPTSSRESLHSSGDPKPRPGIPPPLQIPEPTATTPQNDNDQVIGESNDESGEDPLYDTVTPIRPSKLDTSIASPCEDSEEPIYDAIPARTGQRKLSTEMDGFADRFIQMHRARTHANSMKRPPKLRSPRSARYDMEMDEIKEARLSTDVRDPNDVTQSRPNIISRDKDAIVDEKFVPGSSVPIVSPVKQAEDDIYDVPSVPKPSQDDEVIYNIPSLPPSRPVPQLPQLPSRQPPAPPLPPRDPGEFLLFQQNSRHESANHECDDESRFQEEISGDDVDEKSGNRRRYSSDPSPYAIVTRNQSCYLILSRDNDRSTEVPEYIGSDPDLDLIYESLVSPKPETPKPPEEVSRPAPSPDIPPPPPQDPVYETTDPVKPLVDPVYNEPESTAPDLKEKEPVAKADHLYSDVNKSQVPDPPKETPIAPVVPPPAVVPAPPKAAKAPPPLPGMGPPRPPTASLLASASAKFQPQVIPKVKVLPLHWQKIPPISFKKSIWNELGDISPSIDVTKLEEYFATKPTVVKDLSKTNKVQEKQALLDPKRSQNIGIFLHGTGIMPNTVSELVARIKNGDIKENINSLKKFAPTVNDMKVFTKVPENKVTAMDKADQLMWHMVNTPFFTQRLNIIEVTTTIPDDIDDIKSMIDNILEVCRVLLSSASFLRFLEKILTIGNMMNASIKKTSPGFKLTSTLPKLASVRSSQDKSVTLLDFIVEQAVLIDGDCLKFVNDMEIVHSASQYASIVSLCADVEIMKQDMNKLTGRANEISQKCPHNHPGFNDVETFVDDVRSFVKFFQQNVFLLGEQSSQMKGDFSKVLERFGESPNTDSEEFLKMLSEFQTQLVDSIKRCPQDLPECIAHLKPKAKPTQVPKAKMVAQMNIANSLKSSTLFQRTQNDGSTPKLGGDNSWT